MSVNGFSIKAFQAGEEPALEWLFRRYYKGLSFFADQFLHDSFAAEEIAGNVILKLWEKHQDFSCLDTIKAFLYVSTRNACLNHLDKEQRRRKRQFPLQSIERTSDESLLQDIFRAEALRQIADAIERLPEKYRKVIHMAYMKDMSNDEIASALDLPSSTIRSQKARGLAALKKIIPPSSFLLCTLLLTC